MVQAKIKKEKEKKWSLRGKPPGQAPFPGTCLSQATQPVASVCSQIMMAQLTMDSLGRMSVLLSFPVGWEYFPGCCFAPAWAQAPHVFPFRTAGLALSLHRLDMRPSPSDWAVFQLSLLPCLHFGLERSPEFPPLPPAVS